MVMTFLDAILKRSSGSGDTSSYLQCIKAKGTPRAFERIEAD
tara:strand:- start:502 stop:627 length:126 start_codon:yes stop_codon:yes gene_type:complete